MTRRSKRSSSTKKRRVGPGGHRGPGIRSAGAADKAVALGMWLVILVPPLVVSPAAKESFRLPKLLASEILVLLSLTLLALRLRRVDRVDFRAILRHPAVMAALPFLAVATLTLATTDHPHHVRQGLASLWIGVAALVGWSLGLGSAERFRLLRGLAIPATVLAALGIVQHHLFNPFEFTAGIGERLGLTSLAGGAFDFAGYLVLPTLVAELALWRARTRPRRIAWGVVLALSLYAIALTRTLAAVVAVAIGSLVLWLFLLPRRKLIAAVAVAAVAGAGLAVAIQPLRVRIVRKLADVREGDLDAILSGRFDGWRAALWMTAHHPALGVGHGAFAAEFSAAKLALVDGGATFFDGPNPFFANAHDDVLEAAAECGLAGLLAVAWGIGVVVHRQRRRARAEDGGDPDHLALTTAGLAALAVLVAVWFPLRLALLAYPYVLLLSEILSRPEATTISATTSAEAAT